MKKRVILLVLIGILSTTVSYAQKVTQTSYGAIIDASAIPHTKVKKARSTDGLNSTMGSNTVANIGSAISNEKVYYKLEVYYADFGMNWLSAVNLCRDLSVNGGGWRLPTLRELILMWVLKPELEKIGAFSFGARTFWSATEFNNGNSWYVDFSSGGTNASYKTSGEAYGRRARCVRDL